MTTASWTGAIGAISLAITVTSAAAMTPAHDAGAKVSVAAQGATTVTLAAVTPPVTAVITTRRAADAEAVGRRATRCSGGRVVCSLVDGLTLTVGRDRVEVPPRAVLLLADLDDAQLRRVDATHFELVLTCGDAAPAYRAQLFFTKRRVERLDLWSDEAGMIEQSTVFHDLSKAFR